MKQPLKLGTVVMTSGVSELSKSDSLFFEGMCESLIKHKRGEWGELDPEDMMANDAALIEGNEGRILSAYHLPVTPSTDNESGVEKIWIITEWDRSVTTILFPDEY